MLREAGRITLHATGRAGFRCARQGDFRCTPGGFRCAGQGGGCCVGRGGFSLREAGRFRCAGRERAHRAGKADGPCVVCAFRQRRPRVKSPGSAFMARRFHGRALPRRSASRQGASPLQHFPAASTVTSPAASPAAPRRLSRGFPGDFPGGFPGGFAAASRRLPRRLPGGFPGASTATPPGGFPATFPGGLPGGFPAVSPGASRRLPGGFHGGFPSGFPKGRFLPLRFPRRGALPGAFTEGIWRTYVLEASTARRPCRGKKHGATLFAKPPVFTLSVCLCDQCRAARAILSIIRSS